MLPQEIFDRAYGGGSAGPANIAGAIAGVGQTFLGMLQQKAARERQLKLDAMKMEDDATNRAYKQAQIGYLQGRTTPGGGPLATGLAMGGDVAPPAPGPAGPVQYTAPIGPTNSGAPLPASVMPALPTIMRPQDIPNGPTPPPSANSATPDPFANASPEQRAKLAGQLLLQDKKSKSSAAAAAQKALTGGTNTRGATSYLNWVSKSGLGQINSAAAALDRLTKASNALGANDENSLMAVAGSMAAEHPTIAAFLQTKQGQPLTQEDKQAIFQQVAAGTADEINRLTTQSNAAVSPGMFENAMKFMPNPKMDANHRATALNTMKKLLLEPALTKPLTTLASIRNPDGTFNPQYKTLGVENTWAQAQKMHTQLFGKPWTGDFSVDNPNGVDLIDAPPTGGRPSLDEIFK